MQNAAYLSPSSMTRLAITSPYGYALADVYSELVIDLKAIIYIVTILSIFDAKPDCSAAWCAIMAVVDRSVGGHATMHLSGLSSKATAP